MQDKMIREALDRIADSAPAAVDRFEMRTGEDWSGDPAVWVFVVVNDELEELWPTWDQLRDEIRSAIANATHSEVMVYIRMWSVAEAEEQRRASA